MSTYKKESSSFRDPSGFIFYDSDILYRQINKSYKEDYEQLMNSGLYKKLTELGLLLPHDETDKTSHDENAHNRIIKNKSTWVSERTGFFFVC